MVTYRYDRIIKKLSKSKYYLSVIAAFAVMFGFSALSTVGAVKPANTGFDQFGYNDNARVFVGPADGVDNVLDGKVWGDPTYAKDHLVMKWNAAWDACNAAGNNDVNVCLGAWTDNEWNGNVPGGSGMSDHYKIIWVGPGGESSPYWRDGGYLVWGNYETIMDQGVYGTHTWWAHGIPNGYGVH